MLTSLAVGCLLSRRNTRVILLAGTMLCTLCGVICLTAKTFQPMLIAFGGLGIFMAIFFNAFQAFMRTESAPGDLGRAIGLYTLPGAWAVPPAFFHPGFSIASAFPCCPP